jgi:hypothetical protein
MVSKEEVKDIAKSVAVGATVVGTTVGISLIAKFWGDEIWAIAFYPAVVVGALVVAVCATAFLWMIGENVRAKHIPDINEPDTEDNG